MIAGSGFGATLWIPLQTLFVNPNNIAPVEVEGQEDRCLGLLNGIDICYLAFKISDILLMMKYSVEFPNFSCSSGQFGEPWSF